VPVPLSPSTTRLVIRAFIHAPSQPKGATE
jgi:hypothetical protein